MTDPADDDDRRYDEIKNGDRPPPPQLRKFFAADTYRYLSAEEADEIINRSGGNGES